jgi:hypothetical protein
MSASRLFYPQKADISRQPFDVGFGPTTDIGIS